MLRTRQKKIDDGGGGEGEGEDGRRERGDSGASDEQSEADDRRGACSDNTACATTRAARGTVGGPGGCILSSL